MSKKMKTSKKIERVIVAGLVAAPLLVLPLPSITPSGFNLTAFAAEEKPDLSDWIPRQSTLSFGKDKEYEKLKKDLKKAKDGRENTLVAKTCSEFKSILKRPAKGAKSLQRLDTVRVNFSKDCVIDETITVKLGITITSARGITDSKFDPFHDQSVSRNYQDLIDDREKVFGHGFVCNTKAAPCFLIDTPNGQRTRISGLKFSVKEALFAPLIQARNGRLTAEYNYFKGATIDTGTARQGPALMVENESSTIEGNTFVGQDAALSIYPYMALRSREFKSAFRIGLNVFASSRTGIHLDGTYRFGPRPEVKVYVFGNLAIDNGVALSSRDVRAFHYGNIFDDNSAHMVLEGGESLVEQNIFRISEVAIDALGPSPIYLESNLFEDNERVAPGILAMFEGGSSFPINNICRNQSVESWYEEDLTRRRVLQGSSWSEVPLGKRRGRKTRIKKEFANDQAHNVQSHILFSRPFSLNPGDNYKSCFDLSKIIALDSGQLGNRESKALLRPQSGSFFSGN